MPKPTKQDDFGEAVSQQRFDFVIIQVLTTPLASSVS
jgi:hypothetical protein